MHKEEQQMQQKQAERELHQSVFYGLARSGTQDEFRQAVEKLEYAFHVVVSSPHQMSQAASA